MRLGLNLGYAGARVEPRLDLVVEADRLGYHSVWVAEVYGSDAVSMLAWYGASTEKIHLGSAILQMPARTPAMTAMTAVTLSELSGGRFLLGLGMSGPQVVEGWHGVPYGKPLGVTREYVSILRSAFARDKLEHRGEHYRIPFDGPGSSGLGRALRLTVHPTHDIPIYLAAIGPKNVSLAAEIADGWLPFWYSPFRAADVFRGALEDGFARSGDPGKRDRFDIAPTVPAVVTDETEQALRGVKPLLALYVGGMGARGRNFYFDLVCRYGYEEQATRIQDLYLAGKRAAAVAAVPDSLVEEVALIGPPAALRDKLEAWTESGVSTLCVIAHDVDTLRTLAELVL
ncbi:MAG: LLM class F420-dependent oxidoreductase [Actinomycetota bacterium]|nr:LLM class F420-dependent oxidoreductase [Actinomycetota bacterium]